MPEWACANSPVSRAHCRLFVVEANRSKRRKKRTLFVIELTKGKHATSRGQFHKTSFLLNETYKNEGGFLSIVLFS